MSVPWLNDILVLFSVALHLCQQLHDKVSDTHARMLTCMIHTCMCDHDKADLGSRTYFIETIQAHNIGSFL